MNIYKNTVFYFFSLICIGFTTSSQAGDCKPWVAMAISVQGVAEQRIVSENQSNDHETWQAIKRGGTFCPKDILRVRENSRVALILSNDTVVRLDENTTISFSNPTPDSSSLDLKAGIAHFISRVKQAFKVITPFVNASIEGTEFVVTAASNQAQVTVFEGIVKAENEQGHVVLKQGQTAVALKGQAPVLKVLVNPRNAVQWALYYPTIIEDSNIDPQLPKEVRSKLAQSTMFNARGNASSALNEIDDLPDSIPNVDFYTYRAALRLTVGRTDKAVNDIHLALTINDKDSNALALKSIIAIVKNQNKDALLYAQQAIESDTTNAAAYLALSYAKQALFDLEGAQAAMKDAPTTARIHSRRAELYLMQGDLDNALDHAKNAVNLNTDLSHTQTVLGFAHLIRIEIKEATAAFYKAIRLEQANPLAHLGLGLAMIREGKLKKGRREMEYATSLDPNNSLIRSYLGKAYYQEGRNKVAADQFDMAKALDPKDPTPWFYDALRKQNESDPVSALEDLQQSIALNDNRAVYRSRFLLDQDLATRSASQAKIYSDLSFNELAIFEASKSTMYAPNDSSAYRFLHESYIGNERFQSASASNLLQAKLLQPSALSPVHPHASESNLNTVIPFPAAYNEFTSLFESDEFKLNATLLGGNNDLLSDEVIVTGSAGRMSYSLGQFYYETDGFRDEAKIKHEIYNIVLKYPFTNHFDFQVEYKIRDTAQGDLVQDFSRTHVPSEERELEQDIIRAGGRVNISSNSTFLFSTIDIDKTGQTRVYDNLLGVEIITDEDIDGRDYQIKYISDKSIYNFSIGAGSTDLSAHSLEQPNFGGFMPPPTIIDAEVTQETAFLYFNVFPYKSFEASLGLVYDHMHNSFLQDKYSGYSPKVGVIWKPSINTTVRAAGFKTFKRINPTNQTLEQTHLVGFNQIYDDFNASTAEVYGAAMDYELSNRSKFGLQLVRRDISEPKPPGGLVSEINRDEENYKFHYYQLIDSFAISTELIYEVFDNPIDNPISLKTYKIPVNIRYSVNSHYYTDLLLTYIEQEIEFDPALSAIPEDNESFGLIDLEFGYRFTKWNGSFSVTIQNLLDEKFVYQDYSPFSSDPFTAESKILPNRSIISKILISF